MAYQPRVNHSITKLFKRSLDDVLTVNKFKRKAYSSDLNFFKGLSALKKLFNNEFQKKEFLWNHCLLLIRPDAFFLGDPTLLIQKLFSNKMRIVGSQIVMPSTKTVQLLWIYQDNIATNERKALLMELLCTSPSLILLIRDNNPRISAPATAHLTYLKGPSIIKKRKPWHLRTLIAPPVANILSYLHASDDPADMLREMNLLTGTPGSKSLIIQAKKTTYSSKMLYNAPEKHALQKISKLKVAYGGQLENNKLGNSKKSWSGFLDDAKLCIDYISGESYDPYQAKIPDDKTLIMQLDSYLKKTRNEFNPKF